MEGFVNTKKINNNEFVPLERKNFSSDLSSSAFDKKETALTNYTQTLQRPSYDADIANIIEIVRILNNMAPIRMPIYNFNLNEINGDYYYKPNGELLLVREWDSDLIRDYYVSKEDNNLVDRILEHDKNTGQLRTRIEQNKKDGSRLKTNITIFDNKINNKYLMMQLAVDGTVNNITEFTGKGKSFQSLYRSSDTFKPVRYLEGKDSPEGFVMIDCLFDKDGSVVRLKKYTNKKEININYEGDKKNITVKTKR